MTDAWGIADGYHDLSGSWQPTPPDTREALRAAMGDPVAAGPVWLVAAGTSPTLRSRCRLVLEDGTAWGPFTTLPPDLPLGYHELVPDDGGPTTFVVVHPARAPEAPDAWGVAAQLYALRSAGSQGIGDLADLGTLVRWLARWGAGAVLVSPLHAPAPTPNQQPSPYYPSSRLWRNPLLLRVPGLPADEGPGLVNHDEVWERKRSALQSWFITSSAGSGWRRWVEAQGDSLRRYAVWCTLAERLGGGWERWPADVRHPGASGVGRIDPDDFGVEFHSWCQWLIGRQLAEARRSAPGVAVIGDLAVGFEPGGADAWCYQDLLALGCRVGAPPDAFNAAGQDWGLPPFSPSALRAARFRPFIETVRAALWGVAGLRVDHVMGLFRQWWIPPGARPDQGAYVRYPAEELLAILRVEAVRAGAFLVGEDLGTVEDGVREAMAASGILGTRVATFEDVPPSRYPPDSLAGLRTHDLPTVAGTWQGRDGDDAGRARLAALTRMPGGALSDDVILAAHEALGRSPARLRLAALEDLCAMTDRPNVPGTVHEHPNWRRRLTRRVEEFDGSGLVRASMRALATGRRP